MLTALPLGEEDEEDEEIILDDDDEDDDAMDLDSPVKPEPVVRSSGLKLSINVPCCLVLARSTPLIAPCLESRPRA